MLKRLIKILNNLSVAEYSPELEKEAHDLIKTFFREYIPRNEDLFTVNDVICKIIKLDLFDRYQIFRIANVKKLEDMAMKMMREKKTEVEDLTKLFLLEPGNERGYTLRCDLFNQKNILHMLIDSEIYNRKYYSKIYNFEVVVYILLYALSNDSFELVKKIMDNFYDDIKDFHILIHCFNLFNDLHTMSKKKIEYFERLNRKLKGKTTILFEYMANKLPLIEKVFQKCRDRNFEFIIADMMRKNKGKFLHDLYQLLLVNRKFAIVTKHIRFFFEYSIRETVYGELKYPKMAYWFFRNVIRYIGDFLSIEKGWVDFYQNSMFNRLAKYNPEYIKEKFYGLESVKSQLFLFEQLFNIYYDKETLDKLKRVKTPKWRRIFVSKKKKIRRIVEDVYVRALAAIKTVIDRKKEYEYGLYEGILKVVIKFFKENEEFIAKNKIKFDPTGHGAFAPILRFFRNEKLKSFYLAEMGNIDYYMTQ